jgi:hypothetical protein
MLHFAKANVNAFVASLLTFLTLLAFSFPLKNNGILRARLFLLNTEQDYSCATVRDFHTVPYKFPLRETTNGYECLNEQRTYGLKVRIKIINAVWHLTKACKKFF